MNYRIISLYTLGIFLLLTSCNSKKGCTDPHSTSFDTEAKIDDGSCSYPSTAANISTVRKLKKDFEELSGLKYVDKRLWTIIDPEGEDMIYSINLVTGEPKETIKVSGISSINFEAITASSTDFYIGDIGNNKGNRKDLVIYKVPFPSTINLENTSIAEEIKFYYPEQKDFRSNTATDFDAEAIFYKNGYIYLFTKNNTNTKTSLYEVPATPGNHAARLKGIFDVQGKITDADINSDGTKVILAGHNKETEQVFCWLLKDFKGTDFFTGSKTLIELGELDEIGQVEGATFYNDKNVFISNEKNDGVSANVYLLDISKIQ